MAGNIMRFSRAASRQTRGARLVTPLSPDVSSGIVCFEVEGRSPEEVVRGLAARWIVATMTPYATRYARLSPAIVNTPEEIDVAVEAVRDVAS